MSLIKLEDFIFLISIFYFFIFIILSLWIKFFTKTGYILLILSFAFSLINFFLKNLFLEFFTFSIGFILTFFLIIKTIFLLMIRKNPFFVISFQYDIPRPFQTSEIKLKFNRKLIELIFYNYFIDFKIIEKENLIEKVTKIATIEGESLFFNYIFQRHGRFIIKDLRLVLIDYFGFTFIELKLNEELEIKVFPFFNDFKEVPMLNNEVGSQILNNILNMSSTDFFENRKYYPGDDPRRINWKIFAHIRELHIREVEKIPPNIGELPIIFAPYSFHLLEYEQITSFFISTVTLLVEKGIRVNIISPYSEKKTIVTKENKNEINEIVDYSYKPLKYNKEKISDVIIFASFHEITKLIEKHFLTDCFIIISFFKPENKKPLSFFLRAKEFDSLVDEIINRIKLYFFNKKRLSKLETLKNYFNNNKIKFELYEAVVPSEKEFVI